MNWFEIGLMGVAGLQLLQLATIKFLVIRVKMVEADNRAAARFIKELLQ